jgi:uncharacterized membrane protein
MWVWYSLGSGFFNALWTSQIKSKVQNEGALTFTASIRWGVVVILLPFVLWQCQSFSARWWLYTILSGICESLGIWALAKGARKDYYSTFALSNITPLFTAILAVAFLPEKVDKLLWVGVITVIAGILWLYYRGHWSWWETASALIGAFSGLFSKLVIAESGPIIHACFSFMVGALFCSAFSLRKHGRENAIFILKNVWTYRILIIGSALATYCFYQAVALGPLSRMSPLVRVNMIVGFLLSVFHLKEKQDWQGRGFGAVVLLSGIIMIIWNS